MKYRLTLTTGAAHVVSAQDADKLKQAMLGVGALAVAVRLDGSSETTFVNGTAVAMVTAVAD